MDEKDRIRLEAADLLLDRGMRFTLTDAPLLLRLFCLHRFRVRPLRGGAIAEIARIIVEGALEKVETEADANGKMEYIARVIAVAVLGSRKKIALFSRRLGKLLLWRVPAATLFQIYLIVASINKVSDFMTITGYFALQAAMLMNPRLPGQMEKGS
ncbi:MAG: hypothetical protein LBQ73_02250 [Tannerellaceae bacterium]|jgi:hypothetical protein|nr:hypothetical protein [Tannerellaceae bacterium]